jgi:transposase
MYQRQGQRYASDVTDAEWALIEPKGKPRKTPGRQAGAIESDATLGTALELMVNGDC